jgi:hypothetical protein
MHCLMLGPGLNEPESGARGLVLFAELSMHKLCEACAAPSTVRVVHKRPWRMCVLAQLLLALLHHMTLSWSKLDVLAHANMLVQPLLQGLGLTLGL